MPILPGSVSSTSQEWQSEAAAAFFLFFLLFRLSVMEGAIRGPEEGAGATFSATSPSTTGEGDFTPEPQAESDPPPFCWGESAVCVPMVVPPVWV
ncbi:hypothetical protein PMAYCL1PPCAC_07633, partial [Pristionchus mayeri]